MGTTDSLLYRRGNFNGTFDDLICQAMLEERDAQIALSPGFRWGASLLPGQEITLEDIHNATLDHLSGDLPDRDDRRVPEDRDGRCGR